MIFIFKIIFIVKKEIMRRSFKSGFHTSNTVSYNVITNKIIKDYIVIDGVKFSKRVHNTWYKVPDKKYKGRDYDELYNDYYGDIDSDY